MHLIFMNPQDLIEQALEDVRPMLKSAGRDIVVKDVTGDACVIELSGFCGDCACTDSYTEGIAEIIREQAPQIQNIQFNNV